MRFRDTDYEWSDYHRGLTRARKRRYRKVLDAIARMIPDILAKHNQGHAIRALIPEGVFATGVMGDGRVYAPIVELIFDEHIEELDHEMIKNISTAITNRLPVSHVVVSLTQRVIPVPKLDIELIVNNDEYDETIEELRRNGAF